MSCLRGYNVRDLHSIVELVQIHAAVRYDGIPKILSEEANAAACQNNARGPDNKNQRHGLNSNIHGPQGEQSFI